jgi:tetratricopeptide (TPR) repeat protein
MRFFDGLYPFEIVLLILGVVMFFAVLIAFMRQVFTGRSVTPLLKFFVVPIVMIGFPGFQSIKLEGLEADLTHKIQAVQQNPADTQARNDLQKDASALASRPIADPQVNTKLAEAHFALGNERAAKVNLQKALQANPTLPAAQDVQRKIELADRLKTLVPQVEAAPSNAAARAELSRTVTALDRTRVANPNTMAQLAEANAVLGKPQGAHRNLEVATKINPDSAAVREAQIKVKSMPVAMPNQ